MQHFKEKDANENFKWAIVTVPHFEFAFLNDSLKSWGKKMNSSKSSNQPLTRRNIVYVRMNGCAAAVLRRIVASLISVCAHYRIPDLLSVTKTTEPSDTFVKFTLTPQSTLINTTAGLQAARWSRIHRGSPFSYSLYLSLSHTSTQRE